MSDDQFGPVIAAVASSDDDVFGPRVYEPEAEPARTAGRPDTYSEEIAMRVIDAINDGMTLRDVEKLPGVPNKSTLFRWMSHHPEFNLAYHAALRWRTYARADEIIDITRDSTKDWIEEPDPENPLLKIKVENNKLPWRTKLQIDSLFRVMALENPKKYGMAPTLLEDVRNPQAVPGDNARPIAGAVKLLELHPMREQIEAWRKAATEG